MGRIFYLCPPPFWGSLTLGWRGLCHSRGAPPFFFNALDGHWGSGIPKASPTAVSDPRLAAFFAIQLTQRPNLRFPSLHVTQSIKRPQPGAPGRVAKTLPCEGAARCKGKVVTNFYGCERAALCAEHKDGLCVPCHEGEEPEGGGEEEGGGGRNGVSIEQCAQCLLPVGTSTGHFLLTGWGGGREVVAPSRVTRWGGLQATPTSAPRPRCAMGSHCRGPPCKGFSGIKVLAGTILVVREGMYGGVARVPRALEGVA